VLGGRLRMDWSYSRNCHREETVRRVADACVRVLRELLAWAERPEAGRPDAADFPLAGLSQQQLDRHFAAERDLEDIYPLTPLQQGILFHALYEPDSGAYVEQLGCVIRGELDVPSFRRAWQRVLERHPALRTAFRWEGLEQPLQVVHTQAALPFLEQDWRAL